MLLGSDRQVLQEWSEGVLVLVLLRFVVPGFKQHGNSFTAAMLAAQKLNADKTYAMATRSYSFKSATSNQQQTGVPRSSSGPKGGSNSAGTQPASAENNDVDLGVYKTRLCLRFSTPEGCRYGDKCRFAHGKSDLRPMPAPSVRSLGSSIDSRSTGEYSRQSSMARSVDSLSLMYPSNVSNNGSYHTEPNSPASAPGFGFGSSSTSKKISIGAAFAGAIIGKAGANVKQINRLTGAKVSIREHGTDPNMRNVEMEGSLEQIEQASEMVRQYMQNKELLSSRAAALGSRSFKTKLCKNFVQGTCTFADRCHFAHGAYELRVANLR
ncbi:hypothetical protein AXG93_4225s1000 [Marchantia polymorpha subsp. ruderalis]|uniref:C3H1-type domain-containing protein n=1 Tax=Marchantia polymorpha subsp. ruderalis TaxID=1480154 RepID=A0A176WRP8_MARPO|nr:hypothetical protein AXG93_4225s1000 [Marchantia polymorpha subsp. ruderalis]